MKKLLSIALVLVSFVSYSQVVEKQTTYVIKMTEQEYNDYVNPKSNKVIRKKYNNRHSEKSFGVVAGYSAFLGQASMTNISWGSYIDFGKIGIEYNASVGLNNKDILGSDIITEVTTARGTTSINGKEWITGGGSRNVGVFIKSPRTGLYYGGGIQMEELIGLRGKSSRYSTNGKDYYYSSNVEVFDENKIYPYATIGYIQKLNEFFTFKGGVLLSKTSMVNVGVGYSF